MSTTTLCKTCGQPDHSPMRIYDDESKVYICCVDPCHGEYSRRIPRPSESTQHAAKRHSRPEAKRIRRRNRHNEKQTLRNAKSGSY